MFTPACIGYAVFAAIIVSISNAIFMLLWNFVIPPLFGGPELSFWTSLALCALIAIIFGKVKSK